MWKVLTPKSNSKEGTILRLILSKILRCHVMQHYITVVKCYAGNAQINPIVHKHRKYLLQAHCHSHALSYSPKQNLTHRVAK